METLIVKNFGPIRDVELDLKDLTIFIGETGTGKSTLAKLISIFRDADFWENVSSRTHFEDKLKHYQIDITFLDKNRTYLEYRIDDGICFIYENDKINETFSDFVVKMENQFANNDQYDNESIYIKSSEPNSSNNTKNIALRKNNSIGKAIASHLFSKIFYLPADRGNVTWLSSLVALLAKEKALGPIPPTLLEFVAFFEIASSSTQKSVPIDIFDVSYQKENGSDYIVLSDGTRVRLSDAASGMQTLIPVLILLEHYTQQQENNQSYTFEEPELNLFPLTQNKLVELLAAKILGHGHKLVITTHSPYILTSLNNLIYAYQVGKQKAQKVKKLVADDFWINPNSVSAYYIDSTELRSIIDDESQQIHAEEIDLASGVINLLYDDLIEIEVLEDQE